MIDNHKKNLTLNYLAQQRCLLVVFFEGLHQVPTTLYVPCLNVWVEAGPQRELECLAGYRLRGAVHGKIPSREALVEITLLQKEPKGEQTQSTVTLRLFILQDRNKSKTLLLLNLIIFGQ